jgi:predicted DNA binding CopG/RHH family protein
MAKKKPGTPEPMPATEAKKDTSQARLELPKAEMDRVRRAAKSRGLPLTTFIRLAVFEKVARIEEGRD